MHMYVLTARTYMQENFGLEFLSVGLSLLQSRRDFSMSKHPKQLRSPTPPGITFHIAHCSIPHDLAASLHSTIKMHSQEIKASKSKASLTHLLVFFTNLPACLWDSPLSISSILPCLGKPLIFHQNFNAFFCVVRKCVLCKRARS